MLSISEGLTVVLGVLGLLFLAFNLAGVIIFLVEWIGNPFFWYLNQFERAGKWLKNRNKNPAEF